MCSNCLFILVALQMAASYEMAGPSASADQAMPGPPVSGN